VLLTQEGLRAAGVKTIEDLAQKIPEFSASDAVTANWIPAKLF
jgi:simple sugar transport system substrate-binding protein